MTEIDFTGATWLQVAAWANERIDTWRRMNDGELDPVKTATLRGQIKALKELTGLPEAVARSRSAAPG